MLSAGDGRNILGPNCTLTADELDSLLHSMYKLADVVISEFLRATEHRQESAAPAESARLQYQTQGQEPDESQLLFWDALRILPSAKQERLRERAAVIEFEGGAERQDAERIALLDHLLIEDPNG